MYIYIYIYVQWIMAPIKTMYQEAKREANIDQPDDFPHARHRIFSFLYLRVLHRFFIDIDAFFFFLSVLVPHYVRPRRERNFENRELTLSRQSTQRHCVLKNIKLLFFMFVSSKKMRGIKLLRGTISYIYVCYCRDKVIKFCH